MMNFVCKMMISMQIARFSSPDGAEIWLVYHGTAVNEKGRSSRAMRIPFNVIPFNVIPSKATGWPVIGTVSKKR